MANTLNNVIPTVYEALDVVSRELVGFIPSVSRDSTADRAAKDQTISSHIVPAITAEDITPGDDPADSGDTTVDNVTMTLNKARAAPVRWTGEEQRGVALSGQLQAVQRDRFAQAMRTLVNEVESDIAAEYTRASRAHGTAGTTPFGSNLSDAAEVLKILKDNGAPQDGNMHMVFDTAAGANLRSLTQVTDVDRAGSTDPVRRGVLLDLHGFMLRESAQIKSHTAGSVTSLTVDGAHSVGATSISISGSGVSLNAGDVIDFGGDDQYVVASAVSSTSGPIVINEPGLRVALSGGENVSVNNSGANYTANMAFHRSAMHLVTRAPAMPEGGDSADDVMEVTDPITGLSFQVAMYRQYRRVKFEVGLVWGVKAVKPEHIAALIG